LLRAVSKPALGNLSLYIFDPPSAAAVGAPPACRSYNLSRHRRYLLPSTGKIYTAAKIKKLSTEQQIELMNHWFGARYENPNVLPIDSSDGGLQWIWGGPYDAGDQLRQEFCEIAADDAIAKLSSELNEVSFEWSGKPDDNDYDDDELSQLIADGDPYFALVTSLIEVEDTAKRKRTIQDGKILHRLLFANVITSLETYLGDARRFARSAMCTLSSTITRVSAVTRRRHCEHLGN
jgi:hypothetical protein